MYFVHVRRCRQESKCFRAILILASWKGQSFPHMTAPSLTLPCQVPQEEGEGERERERAVHEPQPEPFRRVRPGPRQEVKESQKGEEASSQASLPNSLPLPLARGAPRRAEQLPVPRPRAGRSRRQPRLRTGRGDAGGEPAEGERDQLRVRLNSRVIILMLFRTCIIICCPPVSKPFHSSYAWTWISIAFESILNAGEPPHSSHSQTPLPSFLSSWGVESGNEATSTSHLTVVRA